ncbi:MAG: glycosyltransferase family 39 protein [Parcubacteria group bacterium]
MRHLSKYLLTSAPAAIYLILATLRLSYPGLHFDEMLHVNAALGGLDGTFVYKTVWQVPVLLMPYIGAIKACFMAPLFAIFGVNPISVRLPIILLVALALLLFNRVLTRWIGRWPALVVCALLALDPTFIQLTRADSGPVALQFILLILALYWLQRYLTHPRLPDALGLWLALGLGVFAKLNFIWTVNALLVAGLVVYGRTLVRTLHLYATVYRRLHLLVHGAGFACIAGYYLLVSYKFNLFTFLEPGQLDLQVRLANFWTNLRGIASGSLFYNYALGELDNLVVRVMPILVAILLVAGLVAIVAAKCSKNIRRSYIFFVLVLLLTASQIFVTRNAVWPWHYFALYPALTLVLVLSGVALLKLLPRPKVWRAAIIITLPLYAVYLLSVDLHYVTALHQPTKNVYWSSAIYELYDYTRSVDQTIVSVDWGTHTQLLGLSQDANKYKNESFMLNRDPLPIERQQKFNTYLSRYDILFVLHSSEHTLFSVARKNFFELVATTGHTLRAVQTISNGSDPLFELYRLSP